MLSVEQRYLIYQEALKDWKRARWIPKQFRKKCSSGFCWYFPTNRLINLHELWDNKPSDQEMFKNNFWFKPGHCAPRIKMLKKAITICEEKIKKSLQ